MKAWFLRKFGLVYLATPYTKFPAGIDAACNAACLVAAALLRERVKVYSPIAHTHEIAIRGGIDPLDLSIWLPFDEAMMERSEALAVATLPAWRDSIGIAHEIDWFARHGKPVFYLDPGTMNLSAEAPAEQDA